ncbi:MAG: histidine kinase, partial [Opitutus sp.]
MKTSATLCLALLAALWLPVLSIAAASDQSIQGDLAERLSIPNATRRPAIARAIVRSDWRIRMGDDIRWAQPDWDDSEWDRLGSMFDSPARRGIFWVRFRVRSPNPADRLPTGIYTSGPIAYELYWDGVLVVRNGVPGNTHEEEVPGRMDVVSTLPGTMTGPGEYTVAMRISSYRCGVPGDKATFRFFMNDPVKVTTWVMRNAIAPTLAAGAMFILAIVCALIWVLAARRPALLFVGSMCLWAAAMQALIALRWFYNYPADWWYPLMLAEDFAHGVFAWCFVAFVIAHFAVPHGRWILAALVPWLAYIHWINSRPPDMQNSWVIMAAYGAAIGPLLWAAWRRRPGAWPVIMGVLASAAWILTDPWLYTWNQFLSRFSPVLLGVTSAIAMQIRVERREAQQTRLTATRLEIELLKKSLQPHFLMNTLTALMEVIEQDQATAVNLIDDLAGEFRLLGSMSAEKTVPLAREIELCRTHLRLMSVRKGRECRLEVENADDAA